MVRKKTPGAYPNRVKKRREQLGLSQSELARRTGIHHSNIWHIEHGYFVPTDATQRKLAKTLRCTIGDLW
jgi:transcriptional regulator with XRE-family HTH domain